MGLMGIFGAGTAMAAAGQAVQGVAEVFTPSATKRMELSAAAQAAALGQLGTEFADTGNSRFDRFINGLNRLPRPMLAFGTLGLFVYAMIDPPRFSDRMAGLNSVPEPLWWLLGAIVSFYFGAREAHYFRTRPGAAPAQPATAAPAEVNPALDDWRAAGPA